jgi:hypothetical protein
VAEVATEEAEGDRVSRVIPLDLDNFNRGLTLFLCTVKKSPQMRAFFIVSVLFFKWRLSEALSRLRSLPYRFSWSWLP